MRQVAGQRRHCWVVLPGAEPMPGLVAGWRRTRTGWQARVAYVLEDDTGGVVLGWLPASVLRPLHPPQTTSPASSPEDAGDGAPADDVDAAQQGQGGQGGQGGHGKVDVRAVEVDAATVRAWARSVGLPVVDRGRVSASLREAYETAHAPQAPTLQ